MVRIRYSIVSSKVDYILILVVVSLAKKEFVYEDKVSLGVIFYILLDRELSVRQA